MSHASISSVFPEWQAGFLSILPKIETHARIQFRRRHKTEAEEAVAEAVAAACASYRTLASQGKLHQVYASTLAGYAVKHVNSGRHVGGRQDAAQDVMSPVAQRRHGVRVFRQRTSWGMPERVWEALASPGNRNTSILDTVAFRIDFAVWLREFQPRDRKIIHALASGDTTSGVAARFNLSPARISELRRKFEHEWNAFQGDTQGQTDDRGLSQRSLAPSPSC